MLLSEGVCLCGSLIAQFLNIRHFLVVTMGITSCSAPNCSNSSKWNKEMSFFRFPKDPGRLKLWLQACNRQDIMKVTPNHAYNNLRLCSKHFSDSCFMNINQKNSLVWDAVPSLFDVPHPPVRPAPPLPKKRRKYKDQDYGKRIQKAEKGKGMEAKKAEYAAMPKPESIYDPELEEGEEDTEIIEASLLTVKEESPILDGSIAAGIKQEYGEWEFLEIKEEPVDIKTEPPDDVLVD